jgi:zinc transport system substrate-binding protein
MNYRKTCFSLIIAIGLLMLSLTGSTYAAKPRLTVGVSIVPQASFVKAVAGGLANVVTMIPPGNSPGNYAPTPREIQALSNAKLYFTIGVPTEQANILPKSKALNKKMKIVNLPEAVEKVYPARFFAPGQRDPHLWLSPKRVKVMVKIIAQELEKVDPKHKTAYQKNANAYLIKLDQLDQRLKHSFSGLTHQTFIVFHPAFGYFADDYGLKMVALEESGKEGSAKNFQELTELAKHEQIKVVFYQKEFDNKQAQALAAEIGGRVEEFAPLAPDYIENLDKMAKLLVGILK